MDKKLLSTSSPEGLQIAAQITAGRLATLLIRKGPLPIRHITAQLALEVSGFGSLSSSKQRRLIMAAMEQADPEHNVVFEKIGWGQWAVRHRDSDYIVTEGTEDGEAPPINVTELRKQPMKLGWSKKSKGPRRESITNPKANLHNVQVPAELLSSSAIESDSDDSDDDDSLSDAGELFAFDDDKKRSPPIEFANRVPLKLSPPPGPHNRRKSSSSHVQKNTHRHHLISRSRLNSLENLDNYIISSAKNSTGSFSSPPPLGVAGSWHHSTSPDSIMATMSGRRKSSFTESSIRSTLSSSLPQVPAHQEQHHEQHHEHSHPEEHSDTDEEDWATIGAESLRKGAEPLRSETTVKEEDETKAAAFALVDLMSV